MSTTAWHSFHEGRNGSFDHSSRVTSNGPIGTMATPCISTSLLRVDEFPQKTRVHSPTVTTHLTPTPQQLPLTMSQMPHGKPQVLRLLKSMTKRTLMVEGAYGVDITLTTSSTGDLRVSHDTVRHRSEPNLPSNSLAPSTTLTRSQSHDMDIYVPTKTAPIEPMPLVDELMEDSYEIYRSVSPTPTEILTDDSDPTPEELAHTLDTCGIKVRDYAYEPGLVCQPIIRELFNPPHALAEYEFRLSLNPRQLPPLGKNLRRLLDIGWITGEEAMARWAEIDWQALKAYDAIVPRPYFVQEPEKNRVAPAFETRAEVIKPYLREQQMILKMFDLDIREQEYLEWENAEIEKGKELFRRREIELQRELREVEARMREREALVRDAVLQSASSPPRKRAHREDSQPLVPPFPLSQSPDGNKRQRLSSPASASPPAAAPSASTAARPFSSQPTRSPRGSMSFPQNYSAFPLRQYPAPLSSYDPKFYPHAHSQYPQNTSPSLALASKSQSKSIINDSLMSTNNVVTPPLSPHSEPSSLPIARSDTPPADQGADTDTDIDTDTDEGEGEDNGPTPTNSQHVKSALASNPRMQQRAYFQQLSREHSKWRDTFFQPTPAPAPLSQPTQPASTPPHSCSQPLPTTSPRGVNGSNSPPAPPLSQPLPAARLGRTLTRKLTYERL